MQQFVRESTVTPKVTLSVAVAAVAATTASIGPHAVTIGASNKSLFCNVATLANIGSYIFHSFKIHSVMLSPLNQALATFRLAHVAKIRILKSIYIN